MWPNVQGQRQLLTLEFPLIDRFLFRQLTKTSINFLSRTEYFRRHDVDASDGYANTQTMHSEWRYFVPHVTQWNRFLPKT